MSVMLIPSSLEKWGRARLVLSFDNKSKRREGGIKKLEKSDIEPFSDTFFFDNF